MVSTNRISIIPCTPFPDQQPGTAGLRRKVGIFRQPHYLECFVQSIFDTLELRPGARLVIGGDGRYHNDTAIRTILCIAAANGISTVITGRNGLMSTPAVSHLIRIRHADAGFILTASHNPGGPDGDFGLKFNTASGGQAPEHVTDKVYRVSRQISRYRTAALPDIDLDREGIFDFDGFTLEVIEPTRDYVRLMQSIFDFDAIGDWLGRGARIRFDAMNAVTGPYARAIFIDALGAPEDSVVHATPLADFGGLHPDPNPIDAASLVAAAQGDGAPDLLAASDGDGDRNMILGPRFFLSPCDSVALMLDHIRRIPGYRDGVPGVARSMPTSRALDTVAATLNVPCHETPTGWRFFCNLLDAGLIGLCGEESFGTGSAHVREKDGLWAVLFWANLLASTGLGVEDLVRAHWRRHGRHHYQRWDYQIPDASRAHELVQSLRVTLPALAGKLPGTDACILQADDFSYIDPVDHSCSPHQGLRIVLDDGSRIVYRLSGTGTTGATLRVYLERHVRTPQEIDTPTDTLLAPLGQLAMETARIRHYTGIETPSGRI